MEFLKKLFENGAIDWETFSKGVTESGFKLFDLSKGDYVSKSKYEDDLKAKGNEITTLTKQLGDRDKDLKDLKNQLEAAGTDSAKLSELTNKLSTLETEYGNAKTNYEKQLAAAKYEYAVKEFANGHKFTSTAAKRDFIRSMIEEGLKFKDDTIMGADDYLTKYKETNADSFIVEEPKSIEPKPTFTTPTTPAPKTDKNPFDGQFNFTGVRPFSNER